MWPEESVPEHAAFARFRTGGCAEAAQELFYQYADPPEKRGGTGRETAFIDGARLESRAGRYAFCRRGVFSFYGSTTPLASFNKTKEASGVRNPPRRLKAAFYWLTM